MAKIGRLGSIGFESQQWQKMLSIISMTSVTRNLGVSEHQHEVVKIVKIVPAYHRVLVAQLKPFWSVQEEGCDLHWFHTAEAVSKDNEWAKDE